MLPSLSRGSAGFRKRTVKCSRSRPNPDRKEPAGPDSASGAGPTLTWLSVGVYTQSVLPSETICCGVGSEYSQRSLPPFLR